jgi:probable H4MPT-linked C1 transfer pathway protein
VIVGLDIGGANLKAASATGPALSRRFALYRTPQRLPAELRTLLAAFPGVTGLAVTMTGELCDCYPTKRAGVNAILAAVEEASAGLPTHVYLTSGRLATIAEARAEPLLAAASNWLALATVAARLAGAGPALLLDIGSTTTDAIPLLDGRPIPQGRTDPDRLQSGELLYQGVRRTPVCALLGVAGAAEFFATMHDVYLILGRIPEDPTDTDTADGRPATIEAAHDRLARMVLADRETSTPGERRVLAERLAYWQREGIRLMVELIAGRLPAPPHTVVVAGSGRFLAREVAQETDATVLDLADLWGPDRSTAACAHALALLAEVDT